MYQEGGDISRAVLRTEITKQGMWDRGRIRIEAPSHPLKQALWAPMCQAGFVCLRWITEEGSQRLPTLAVGREFTFHQENKQSQKKNRIQSILDGDKRDMKRKKKRKAEYRNEMGAGYSINHSSQGTQR